MTRELNTPGRLSSSARYLSGFLVSALFLTGCGVIATRPARHLGYAETAFIAAQKANAEAESPQEFQLARETLLRARAAYRLKNFNLARKLAVRARLLSEEAEFLSMFKDADKSLLPKSNPEGDEF